jgi:hypothetical protein
VYLAVFFAVSAGRLLSQPGPAWAFFEQEEEDYTISLRGFVNGGVGLADYPEDNFLYHDQDGGLWSGDFRLLFGAYGGDNFRAEANVLQNVRSTPPLLLPGSRAARLDVERSAVFYSQQHDSENSQASLVLDTADISIGNGTNELIIGRQPISMSVTFYFTPNDFFAPFAPQNFYREYKPGVDAVRYERRLGNLTQFTLVSVLGYEEDPDSGSGWSRDPDWQRTSMLGRLTTVSGDFEWGFIGGYVPYFTVLGASLQGELFGWLGVRAEGHYQETWKDSLKEGLQLSVGFEHSFSGRLSVRLEQMHNGTGYTSIREVDEAIQNSSLRPGYLGRDYTAADISYEFSPLLAGEFLYLHNWTDSSGSFSLYGVYSLSNESELALTVTLPLADRPDRSSLRSEFGVLPSLVTMEYRLYF